MSHVLFSSDNHKNVLLPVYDQGHAVPSNQHLIIHDGHGMILDPGGHKIYNRVLSDTTSELAGSKLDFILLSHQDPDIVAAVNGWLMTTDAIAYAPSLWVRFIPHFGLDRLVVERLKPIPDQGMRLAIGGQDVFIIPAHFLHSCGNVHVYDPISKILYSGDLGASIDSPYIEVPDFEAHAPKMLGFHQRYMACNAAMRAWVSMVRTLDVETIAPQHGALFRGKDMVQRFLGWAENLQCGIDLMADSYKIPA